MEFHGRVSFRELNDDDRPIVESWFSSKSGQYIEFKNKLTFSPGELNSCRSFLMLHDETPIGLLTVENRISAIPLFSSTVIETFMAVDEYKQGDYLKFARAKFLQSELTGGKDAG